MDGRFVASTDSDSVVYAVIAWAESADPSRIYSMADVVLEIYGVEYETDEFWRVAPAVGDGLRTCGFKQVSYRNRRFWVKK